MFYQTPKETFTKFAYIFLKKKTKTFFRIFSPKSIGNYYRNEFRIIYMKYKDTTRDPSHHLFGIPYVLAVFPTKDLLEIISLEN